MTPIAQVGDTIRITLDEGVGTPDDVEVTRVWPRYVQFTLGDRDCYSSHGAYAVRP